MTLPKLPTEEMIAAGLRTLQSATNPDRGLVVDIFKGMLHEAPQFPHVSGNDISRLIAGFKNMDYSDERRWMSENGERIVKSLTGLILEYAAEKENHDR